MKPTSLVASIGLLSSACVGVTPTRDDDPDHSIVRASQEGLQAVLFKPFKVGQLLEQVYAALDIVVDSDASD